MGLQHAGTSQLAICEVDAVFLLLVFLQVWHNLQQTGFLPHCVSAKISEVDKTKVE